MNKKRKKNTDVLAILSAAVDLKWHKFYQSAKSDTNIIIIAIDNYLKKYVNIVKNKLNYN